MAHERRPPKGRKFASVDSFEDPPDVPAPNVQEYAPGDFFHGFDNMHSDSFRKSPVGGQMNNRVKGPKVDSLESLVAKLAELQFIVKGKIDSENNVELMFCSPEPIVTQEVPPNRVPQEVCFAPRPEVRYIEAPRKHVKKREGRRRTIF
jgi:hypothetical protein